MDEQARTHRILRRLVVLAVFQSSYDWLNSWSRILEPFAGKDQVCEAALHQEYGGRRKHGLILVDVSR